MSVDQLTQAFANLMGEGKPESTSATSPATGAADSAGEASEHGVDALHDDGDERPAHEVKRDLFAQMQKDYFNANHWPRKVEESDIVVFEDDSHCVEMYQKMGCYVNHVKHDKARS